MDGEGKYYEAVERLRRAAQEKAEAERTPRGAVSGSKGQKTQPNRFAKNDPRINRKGHSAGQQNVKARQFKKFVIEKADLIMSGKYDADGKCVDENTPTNKLPLVFLYDIYNDPRMPLSKRIEAARASLPYLHKRLPIEILSPNQVPLATIGLEDLVKLSDDELDVLEALIRKLGPKRPSDQPLDAARRFIAEREAEAG